MGRLWLSGVGVDRSGTMSKFNITRDIDALSKEQPARQKETKPIKS